jgi:hypothetical protein
MSGMTPELYRENMIELIVLQALLGVLSSRVKALTLEFEGEDVIAYFLLREESPEDREEIEENFAAEVEAFTLGVPGVEDTLVRPVIHLAQDYPPGYVPPGRRVFRFRD